MAYLYKIFDNPFARKALEQVALPSFISDNLKFDVRPYQVEAFKRYVYLDKEEFEEKPDKPYHLMYNMATGSGKTLVMAGLMLFLYEKGYRNFLFFVNSNNIIQKTKENFLNPFASKYLFKDKIVVDGKEVLVKEVDNFDEADEVNINIKFVSIQMLTSGLLLNVRENGLSFEDFEDRKLVLLGDEAHHNNADVWGDLVKKTHELNYENILLEFTATLDYDSQAIAEKYQDKVIYKYDLAQFRLDKYSKEINLVRSMYDEQERIIQALILNLYRQELATSRGVNLKPVILFKAKRTIAESKENKAKFHKLIENFSPKMVENIRDTSTVEVVQNAFTFFAENNLTDTEIANRIKSNFKQENCLSANNDAEAEQNQIRLNTLEDINNPIRAVFAVQKLNEGWDVLNLFDIVRLYEGQNAGGSDKKTSKATLSEAQLIGRGARYYPFKLEEGQEKYKRKFDDQLDNDFKVLEELYYHTKDESKYIYDIKKALRESGAMENDENSVQLRLTLKPEFKETEFYKTGKVIYNKRVEKSYDNIKSFADLGVSKRNIQYTLSSGIGVKTDAFAKEEKEAKKDKIIAKDIRVLDIPKHITKYALTQNPFYYFDSLERFFPKIESITNFIESKEYLAGLEIAFSGTQNRLEYITNDDYLSAIQKLLQTIEIEIKSNLTDYEGSEYINDYVHKVFKDKEIRTYKDNPRADGQFDVVSEPSWYVYNANYGTSEEKEFVKMFARRFEHLEKQFKDIYLIRNEREIKIIDKQGRAFEPDFVLFCKQKTGEELTYQIFIEPKGKHLKAHDKWKEDFLQEIRESKTTITLNSDKYLITGVPFYNNESENEFKKTLEETLDVES
ncbi:DEAD/DEAH box helicase family protein [uncultured Algibacter sp.]|uniref:DEAD/DEAH box helicase family protein n=1 Tax=uncultured Algibacter sp. TaxID=298659 RepID=UPI0026265C8E|nr:DEAD/DEAH box helicase family protein [uncultured Algibacter sp.]